VPGGDALVRGDRLRVPRLMGAVWVLDVGLGQ
jgi:hypothetical protein